MRVLVTGANGQLGYDVIRRLAKQKIEYQGVDIGDFDLTDGAAVLSAVQAYKPDAVVHCAAFTAVDKAEEQQEICRAVNVNGTRNVAIACREAGAKMVYISTDYVFDGKGTAPFEPDSPTGPLNFYGLTKLLGENEVRQTLENYFVVRTSWVFGVNGGNFVRTMLRLGNERDTIDVVNDQVGSPTYTFDLASLLCDMLLTEKYGVYHATNEGFCAWSEFAAAIMKEAGLPCKIHSIPTSEYRAAKATRPLNSRLSKEKLTESGFQRLPAWQDALRRFLGDFDRG
ncbi:MAG TPA: dTDP-4-dehydrorhamnose reductase [Oscillospiraceae bacterium]|nr:dTDP-4-dehydrorhamnose reductase [Oscillospiraceae bacterium]HPK36002.1 dTDP-4-dehydrorhamnose reductase [Oscillospiraceae bacterium]HPR76649.1 dTDP-4-dehydrorhamnose reductase [Oscillospiraceae bacterium]